MLRVNSASEVPKTKSPRTQTKMEDWGEAKADSGQSMKLGKVARKWAFARYSGNVELCAERENEKTGNTNTVSIAMVGQQPLRGKGPDGFARRSGNTNSPGRQRGQAGGHLEIVGKWQVTERKWVTY